MDYTPMLETALRAAREAGAMARASCGKPGYMEWKGARDLVVGSVLPIQQRIIDIIHSDFPQDSVLAEETLPGQDSLDRPSTEADPLWVVDPIDGTINFCQGIPHYAISIAYRAEGVYQVGVVYDPSTDEMYSALQGRFARLNGEPINVQQLSEGEDAYNRAIVGTDLPGGFKERLQSL